MPAAFSFDPELGQAPLNVQFTDESTGGPSAWDWDFGDGSAHATTQNPTHTFVNAGNFTVTLTATIAGEPSVVTHNIQVNPVFNCACEDETNYETLEQLRTRLLVRLGYAAQAENPPPGMALLLNDFLVSSQRELYRTYAPKNLTRFFTWTMIPGQRMYDLPDNDETCDKKLEPTKIEYVGVEDLNGAWYDLVEGIPPNWYTSVSFSGIPSRYEIRQCIEVFVAPSDAFKLRIKGSFGLLSFTEDEDKATIDSELVFLWALAAAKAHYGQPDAEYYDTKARQYLRQLVAGNHMTARYIPGKLQIPPWTRPFFLPIGGS